MKPQKPTGHGAGDDGALRLGAVERAILDLVNAGGGPLLRTQVLDKLYPNVYPARPAVESWAGARANATHRTLAEATVSRAIRSLVRKGLIVRERQAGSGRAILRSAHAPEALPDWEHAARAEEDFAARASSHAEHWRTLAVRARQRALRLREDRHLDSTDDERRIDTHVSERLAADGRADVADAVRRRRFSLARRVRRMMRGSDPRTPRRSYPERVTDAA